MANTIVTDVTQMMATNVTNYAAGIENSGKVSEGNEFSKIFDVANEKVAKPAETGEAMNQSGQGTKIDKSSTKEIKNDTANTKDTVNNADDRKEVAKASIDSAKKIEEKVKETFEISDEELESAMEILGMTMQDLLDPNRLKELMGQISGITDSISLITNAEVYNQVKEVMNFAFTEIENLEKNLGITDEQLTSVIKDVELMNEVQTSMETMPSTETDDFDQVMKEVQSEVPNDDSTKGVVENSTEKTVDKTSTELKTKVSNDTAVENETTKTPTVNEALAVTGNTSAAEDSQVTSQEVIVTETDAKEEAVEEESVVVNSDPNVKVTVNRDDESTKTNLNENSSTVTKEENVDLGKTETFKEVEKTENDPLRNKNRGLEMSSRIDEGEVSRFNVANETANFGDTITQTSTQVNTVGDLVETVTSYSNVDGREILSQVTESIRVDYSADTTSLELQLHPASLGTVNMQVSSTNGIVTAHIIVQNEAVKTALESQLITLTQTFEEQGHKVEAVEVSIANYDLNQGMNRDNGQNPSEREEKGNFRVNGARRRINMNDLDDGTEEITGVSEEEKIARDMMARNGNTVDYTV